MTVEYVWTFVSLAGFIAALAFVADAVLNRAAVMAEVKREHGERRHVLRDAKTLAEWQVLAGALITLNFAISVALGVLALADSQRISDVLVWALIAENAALMAAMFVLWAVRVRIMRRL